jgi:hypothetical protein
MTNAKMIAISAILPFLFLNIELSFVKVLFLNLAKE